MNKVTGGAAKLGATAARDRASEATIVLELLGAVEKGDITQRRLSRELGIAVGLVNAYMKRCISKGYIKVSQVPPRRYAYYLTPKGFVEKSRLVADYFVSSFDFFRRARASCKATLAAAEGAGHDQLVLFGISDLAEITIIVATELKVKIVAVVDAASRQSVLLGVPVVHSIGDVTENADAAVVTSLSGPRATLELARKCFGNERVYMPSVLADLAGVDKPAPFRTNGKTKT
jgi:predicted transcriptional regulator